MYKTNAKRKSHMMKNHPDCELPGKPSDKVSSGYKVVDNFMMNIVVTVVLYNIFCLCVLSCPFIFRLSSSTMYRQHKWQITPRPKCTVVSGVINNTCWKINCWNTNGPSTIIYCLHSCRSRGLWKNIRTKRKIRNCPPVIRNCPPVNLKESNTTKQ